LTEKYYNSFWRIEKSFLEQETSNPL